MRFLSLFSGIEAASVAFLPLGWECVAVAEIEKFPCAVLKHHYPGVKNLGDVTKITKEQIEALGHIDVCIFGFPCTDLSVAGQRKGLKHADGTLTRSGLFFPAARIADWSRARWTVAENVPGLFSIDEGRAFATVVGELAGNRVDVPRDGWRNSGCVLGPKGLIEFTVLDAQFFGLAQRRQRVFIVRDTGNWADRPPLLFESKSLLWNYPPRRSPGQGAVGGVAPSIGASGRGTARAGESRGQDCVIPINMQAAAKNGAKSPNALVVGQPGDPAHTVNASDQHAVAVPEANVVAHSLTGEGFDASEDGTGRGTPLIPEIAGTMMSCNDSGGFSNSADHAAAGYMVPELSPSLPAGGNKTGGDRPPGTDVDTSTSLIPEIVSQAMSAKWSKGSSGPAGDEVCNLVPVSGDAPVQVQWASGGGKTENPTMQALRSGAEHSYQFLRTGMAVRRLLPVECERLMGFPDRYTEIPWNGKPASECPDGNRYKSLGNSMAVPIISWLGQRIQMVINLPKK